METKIVDPQHCSSVQDYLEKLGFIINGDYFIKGNIAISVMEIAGFTPVSFAQKAFRKGWLGPPSTLFQWQDQFYYGTGV